MVLGHTLYGCVDWNLKSSNSENLSEVTPCMGVWIETISKSRTWLFVYGSHPVWVCGLKHDVTQYSRTVQSHTLYGCVDWNKIPLTPTRVFVCHTLYGCVDWNDTFGRRNVERWGHTLYGCVDWNIQTKACRLLLYSHTLYGCVDWNRLLAYQKICNDRHTLYGCVDWNFSTNQSLLASVSHTLYGCVDWNLTLLLHIGSPGESHPVWVCGLKLNLATHIFNAW